MGREMDRRKSFRWQEAGIRASRHALRCFPTGTSPPVATSRHFAYDAFEQLTQTVDRDGTIAAAVTHHGLSEELQDAENLAANTGSTHTAAYSVRTRDGHGRVGSLAVTGDGSIITTTASYLPTGEMTSISRAGTITSGGTVTRMLVASTSISYGCSDHVLHSSRERHRER